MSPPGGNAAKRVVLRVCLSMDPDVNMEEIRLLYCGNEELHPQVDFHKRACRLWVRGSQTTDL